MGGTNMDGFYVIEDPLAGPNRLDVGGTQGYIAQSKFRKLPRDGNWNEDWSLIPESMGP